MDTETYKQREDERMARLLEFVKGEVRNTYVGARLQFTIDLFTYLAPEVRELVRSGRIEGIEQQ